MKKSRKAEDLVKSIFSVPLRHLVLNLIAIHGEMHGYEIMNRIKELTSGLWKPSTSTLYMVLETLVKEGLLEKREEYRGRVKRVKYRLTEKGLEILSLSTDLALKIMYRITERLETVNQMLRERRVSVRRLKARDLEKRIEVLRKIREYIDKRLERLEKEYMELLERERGEK